VRFGRRAGISESRVPASQRGCVQRSQQGSYQCTRPAQGPMQGEPAGLRLEAPTARRAKVSFGLKNDGRTFGTNIHLCKNSRNARHLARQGLLRAGSSRAYLTNVLLTSAGPRRQSNGIMDFRNFYQTMEIQSRPYRPRTGRKVTDFACPAKYATWSCTVPCVSRAGCNRITLAHRTRSRQA
jgi:hypothetical protein